MEASERNRGLTLKSFLLAVILLALSVLWIREVELINFTCQITESIPPIPAIAVALLFGVLLPALRRFGIRIGLSKAEQAVIYTFVAIGCVMSAVGVAQAFLPYLVVPDYFATPENIYGEMRDVVPHWVGPRDEEVVRTFFEGSPGKTVAALLDRSSTELTDAELDELADLIERIREERG